MTFFEWYLILIHALAFLGLSLAGAIARHIWRTWETRKPDPVEHFPDHCETTIHASPSYGLRIIK